MSFRLSPRGRVLLAFGCVYLFWGSTYTAIHIAGEHLPPPVVSATRSLITTCLLVLLLAARRQSLRVPLREAWRLALVGVLFMTVNNMLLTWAETMVPSGFASLVISTMPIMVALLEMALPAGESLNARGWLGTLLGLGGILVLVWPSLHGSAAPARALAPGTTPHAVQHPLHSAALGVVLLLLAAFAFATGSVLSRRFRFQADTLVATAWQLGSAAVVNGCIMFMSGSYHRAVWTAAGFGSIVYLSIFGSIFGLVAFTYLLQHAPVTKVATYAFVNPVIAVLLGVLLLHERLLRTEVVGMAVIIVAVALVVLSRVKKNSDPAPANAGVRAGT